MTRSRADCSVLAALAGARSVQQGASLQVRAAFSVLWSFLSSLHSAPLAFLGAR